MSLADAIINIVDATNLSRSLFFTTQLLELGIPVVVALNKSDMNEKKGIQIDEKALSDKLGCPVIQTISTSSGHTGLKEVVTKAASLKGCEQRAPYVQDKIDLHNKSEVEAADRKRFDFVKSIVSAVEKRKVLTKEKNSQDKIDAVLTNPWLGIPIFAVIMFLVFYISQAESPIGLGKLLEGIFTGWIESFQGWVAGLVENTYFESWLESISYVRNICAHYGRLPTLPLINEGRTNYSKNQFTFRFVHAVLVPWWTYSMFRQGCYIHRVINRITVNSRLPKDFLWEPFYVCVTI